MKLAKKNVHVVKSGNSWEVKREGSSQPISTHRTQGNAEDAGRRVAKVDKVELVTHRPNGQIRDKDSFGNDPKAIRDTKH